MEFELWLSFALFAGVAATTPGPAVLLAVTHGGLHGVRGAVFPVFGNVTGLALIISATAIGIGSVLEASSQWFTVLRVAGGLYLVYLGIKLLLVKPAILSRGQHEHPGRTHSALRAYGQGLAVALSNPKALLFIGAVFPQFLDVSLPVWPQFMIMGLTLMSLSFSILISYAALSGKVTAKSRHALSGKVNKVSGVLFILFGTALAAGSR